MRIDKNERKMKRPREWTHKYFTFELLLYKSSFCFHSQGLGYVLGFKHTNIWRNYEEFHVSKNLHRFITSKLDIFVLPFLPSSPQST